MAEDIPSKETSEKIPLKDAARARAALERAAQKGDIPTQPVKPKIEHVSPFYPKPKVDWQPVDEPPENVYKVEKEEQHQAEENTPWFKRIFAKQREKFPPAPPTENAKAKILRRQSEAGYKGQPELTTEERRKIQEINFPSTPLTEEEKALLKKQGTAGIGGVPNLTPEERSRIAEINARSRRQTK